jgi:hypothetical protein
VLGDFGDVTVDHYGVETRFFRDGDRFMVTTDGPDGAPTTWPIAYAVGVTPLQQYLVETENGHLQALDLAWNSRDGGWFHLYPTKRSRIGRRAALVGALQELAIALRRLPPDRVRKGLHAPDPAMTANGPS